MLLASCSSITSCFCLIYPAFLKPTWREEAEAPKLTASPVFLRLPDLRSVGHLHSSLLAAAAAPFPLVRLQPCDVILLPLAPPPATYLVRPPACTSWSAACEASSPARPTLARLGRAWRWNLAWEYSAVPFLGDPNWLVENLTEVSGRSR